MGDIKVSPPTIQRKLIPENAQMFRGLMNFLELFKLSWLAMFLIHRQEYLNFSHRLSDCDSQLGFLFPGDYTQNHCNHSNSLCKPCSTRFHSCVGLPDGDNAMPNGQWIPEYISCYKNRTMETKHCKHGNFDPVTMACTSKIDHSKYMLFCFGSIVRSVEKWHNHIKNMYHR